MIFNKNVKYKCKNARVVKCVSNEMVCHVVEIKVDNIWMPYKVTGDLSHAIDIIAFICEKYIINQHNERKKQQYNGHDKFDKILIYKKNENK